METEIIDKGNAKQKRQRDMLQEREREGGSVAITRDDDRVDERNSCKPRSLLAFNVTAGQTK